MNETPPAQPASGLARSLRQLERSFLRPYRGIFLIALLSLLSQSALLLPIPVLQGWMVDRLVAWFGRGSAVDTAARTELSRGLMLALTAMVACHLSRAALAWWVSDTTGRISQEVVVALRTELHAKLLRLPMAYFDAHQTGRLMARVTSDVGSILGFVNSGLLQLVNDLLLAAGIAIVLIVLDWRLALVALVVLPLYILNQKVFATRIHTLSLSIRAQISAIYALLSERVSAVRIVRSFAQEDAELATLDERIDEHRRLSWQNTRTHSLLGALATAISGLGTVIVLTLGAWFVGQGSLSVGGLLAFYALVGQLYGPIVRLTQFQATAQATAISIERLFEVLHEPESVTDRPGAQPLLNPRGALAFRGVSFAYRPEGPDVLEEIDLEIEPGTTLGILGPSGAGKSTLLALAARFYDVADERGAVLFDGIDVRDLQSRDLRLAMALVPQQALLFEGTLRSNLSYARPDSSEDRLWHALEITDLARMVRALPDGLDTSVGERGQSLSGGQRQRMAVARALIAEPRVLLLDDCTSALDAETESRIQDALHEHLPDRTQIIVSHKASSLRRADRIIVLDAGRIVEQGTHDELMDQGGLYAENFLAQTEVLAVE
jgi:ABC-type multidrug transport system fused ATPase/permease subunit